MKITNLNLLFGILITLCVLPRNTAFSQIGLKIGSAIPSHEFGLIYSPGPQFAIVYAPGNIYDRFQGEFEFGYHRLSPWRNSYPIYATGGSPHMFLPGTQSFSEFSAFHFAGQWKFKFFPWTFSPNLGIGIIGQRASYRSSSTIVTLSDESFNGQINFAGLFAVFGASYDVKEKLRLEASLEHRIMMNDEKLVLRYWVPAFTTIFYFN